MPTKFTVKNTIGEPRSYSDRHGPKVAYPIEVEDETGMTHKVEWSRLPTSPAPEAGLELEAEGILEPLPQAPEGALPKLNKAMVLNARRSEGQPYEAPASGSAGEYYGRRTNPEDAARMARSAAHKAAAVFVTGMAQAGVAPGPELDKWAALWLKYTEMAEDHASELDKEEREAQDNGSAPAEQAAPEAKTETDSSIPF